MIGKVFSHYQILEKLGEGGMGVVYKAEDLTLRRTVALKFLPQYSTPDKAAQIRFTHEARAASSLNHPNITTIYEIDEFGGQMFIAMEYCEGKTLREILQSENLQVKKAIDIALQVCEGLALAHEKGIVHRDIKPDNIMVTLRNQVKIMDFGLAKLRGVSRLTKEGGTVGTAGYMSPEHLQGQDADQRSDIFSLGVLLYELFAGQPPFKGTHNAALMYEIVNINPPLVSTLRPGIDPEIDRIVIECMQKDPADRFQSAAEIAKELRRVRHASDVSHKNQKSSGGDDKKARPVASSPPSLPPSGNRWFKRVSLIVAVIVLTAAGLSIWRPWGATDSHVQFAERFLLPLPRGCSLELGRDGLAISPDGKHLALIAREDSSPRLFMRDMDQFEIRPVAATAGLNISGVFFSPDGQWLGFFANGKLMKLSLRGGTPVTICDVSLFLGQASWGEGGNIVFIKEFGGCLWIVSSEAGSVARPLTALNLEAGERAHLLPRVLPGGKEALFTIWRGGAYTENLIAVVDLNSGKYRTVVTGGNAGCYLRTGHMMYTHGSTLMAVPFDAKTLKVSGEPVPVLDKVLMNGSDAFSFFAVSDNGTLAYAPGEIEYVPTAITLIEHGLTIRHIEPEKINCGYPLFSPDGKALAVIMFGTTFQVGVYDLLRNALTPLTFAADNIWLTWFPDGSRIAFSSNVEGAYQVYTVAADGSGTPQKLFNSNANPLPRSWSHDLKSLAYVVTNKETGTDIWLYSAASVPSTRPLIAARANESDPKFSPDGHWLAYVSDESGGNEVYVQPFPSLSGRWRVSNGEGITPVWSPDGRRILFQRNDEILAVPVAVTERRNGPSITIGRETRFLARSGLISFDLSPNGKTVVIGQSRAETLVDHLNIIVNWSEELRGKVGPL
jgi:serine/threonine protein kinase/Tol biopolymer transport system component